MCRAVECLASFFYSREEEYLAGLAELSVVEDVKGKQDLAEKEAAAWRDILDANTEKLDKLSASRTAAGAGNAGASGSAGSGSGVYRRRLDEITTSNLRAMFPQVRGCYPF